MFFYECTHICILQIIVIHIYKNESNCLYLYYYYLILVQMKRILIFFSSLIIISSMSKMFVYLARLDFQWISHTYIHRLLINTTLILKCNLWYKIDNRMIKLWQKKIMNWKIFYNTHTLNLKNVKTTQMRFTNVFFFV